MTRAGDEPGLNIRHSKFIADSPPNAKWLSGRETYSNGNGNGNGIDELQGLSEGKGASGFVR